MTAIFRIVPVLCMNGSVARATGLLLCLLLTLAGCQSQRERNLQLINDRVTKLKPLTGWQPTWCRVEARLTQPALARYHEMFPDEKEKLTEDTWAYTWKARKTACEVTSLETSPLTQNHHSFLEAAMCLLIQVYFVNSPFEDLTIVPDGIMERKDKVYLRTSDDPELGLYLDPKSFTLETRTKSRGVLSASYNERDHEWLPDRLEQETPSMWLVVDSIEYDNLRIGRRRQLKSFWISVGSEADKVSRHTEVRLSSCQPYSLQ